MKLTVILLAVALNVTAGGYSQNVTLSFTDAPVQKVFAEIERQTGLKFLYSLGVIEGAKTITVKIRGEKIDKALALCFKEQPFSYDIQNDYIILSRNQREKIASNSNELSPVDIKGRVINKEGEPLASASVVVKRTGRGTQTDANGNFSLENLHTDDLVTITYTGYIAQTTKIGERTNFTIILEVATSELDRVLIQAYGQTTQRLATGNIAKVTAEEIEKQPVINPLQALQGKVPGLIVSQTSGFGSAPFKIEIRGRNSINPSFTSDPLYIIDGVPLTVLDIAGSSGYFTGSSGFIQNGLAGPAGGQSPLFSLNPADIESIEILKDADATSIYGSRGANGVILITTKKGKSGKTKLDINLTHGVSKVSKFWDMLSTEQYLAMRREALANDGITPNPGNAPDLEVWDNNRYTDWQKEIWGGTGRNTNLQIGLSGGNDQTSFRVASGYFNATNILSKTGKDERASLSFNLNHYALNRKFKIGFGSNYSFTRSDMITLPTGTAALAPNAPSIFDDNGRLNYKGWEPIQWAFPFASLLQPYTAKTNFLNSYLKVDYQIVKGINFMINVGYNNSINNQKKLMPIVSQDPTIPQKGTAQFGNNFNSGWIIEPQLNYNSYIGKGKIDVLVGATSQLTKTEGSLTQGSGYTSDLLLNSVSNAPIRTASQNFGEYRYAAVFGRVNYQLLDKYIINLTARRDGSSRFGEGKQFGNFGSVGAAWIFSDENLIKKNLLFISYGKIRGSYGTTGSDAVGDYQYLSRWGSTLLSIYNGASSLLPIQHANPDFQWQLNKKIEAAVDLGVLQNRINLSVVYYQNECGNQLLGIVLPSYTGFNSVTGNWPAVVQNKGWEFQFSTKVIENKAISWLLNFNIGFNRNKLTDYPNLDQSPYASILEIGKPVSLAKLLNFTGVDPQTGLFQFEDKNKDGEINRNDNSPLNDLFSIDLSPKYSGGFGSTLNYKTLQFSMWFTFIKQIGRNGLYGIYPGTFFRPTSNTSSKVLSRWQKPGDITNVAKFTSNASDISYENFYNFSDGIYTNASFVRLSNISLSYRFPAKYIQKMGIKECSIFVNAQNLLTLTNYEGLDPETQNFDALPTPKTIVVGISFNF